MLSMPNTYTLILNILLYLYFFFSSFMKSVLFLLDLILLTRLRLNREEI